MESIAQEFSDVQNEDCSPYSEYIRSFNADQLRIFGKIISSLHAQFPSIPIPNNVSFLLKVSNPKPIFMFVSGYGGTGKSYLIKGLTSYVKQVFKSHVALMAPTGIAASNINGLTVHRLLQLPIQHGSVPPYFPLADHSLHQLKTVYDDVILFILDEISMVNNLNFVYIHKRLCELSSEPVTLMGGRNLLVLGDLLQLSPVSHGPVFADLSSLEKEKLNAFITVNIWHAISYDELTENVRQIGDPRYAKLLKDVRLGSIDPEDEEWLLDNCIFRYSSKNQEDQRKEIATFVHDNKIEGRDYTILVPTNAIANQLNEAVLNTLDGPKFLLEATDCIAFRHSTKAIDKMTKARIKKIEEDARQTAGLESCLTVKKRLQSNVTPEYRCFQRSLQRIYRRVERLHCPAIKQKKYRRTSDSV